MAVVEHLVTQILQDREHQVEHTEVVMQETVDPHQDLLLEVQEILTLVVAVVEEEITLKQLVVKVVLV
mgnify:CR=1 FL=1